MKRRSALAVVFMAMLVPAAGVAARPGPMPDKGSFSATQSLSPASAQVDCPQSGGVIFYYGWHYQCDSPPGGDPGYRLRATPGLENISGEFDNNASSVRVPTGWSVKLYELADGGGASVCRTADDPDFVPDMYDDGTIALNDTLSSFQVFGNGNCGSSAPPAVLWQDPGYPGAGLILGEEMFVNLTDVGWNDVVSSVKIAPGWSARLYRDINRDGTTRCFNRNDIDFANDTFEDGSPLDNQVSSIDVYHQSECPCVQYVPVSCGLIADGRNDGPGSTDVLEYYSCAVWLENGPEVVYALTTDTPRRVTVTLTNLSADLDLFVLEGSCNVGACIAYSGRAGNESVSFFARAGHPHYIVVDGYYGAVSSYHIEIACADASVVYLPVISGH